VGRCFVCFFFSSRRRHTRFDCDWSSDVCSSDLELAAAAKQDPVAYRRGLLGKSPRARAVLDLAAQAAGWGQPLPAGRGRGVSLLYSGWGSYLAQVAEVSVSKSGEVRVHRIVCAVDCGTVVNPATVKAQIEGGIGFGIGRDL